MLALAACASGAHAHRVLGTQLGKLGEKTANGHVIQPMDWFVALPSVTGLAGRGTFGIQARSRVRVRRAERSVIAPVWDIGPWNILDDYWNGSGRDPRGWGYLAPDYSSKAPPNFLAGSFRPEVEAARSKQYNFGYTSSKPGPGGGVADIVPIFAVLGFIGNPFSHTQVVPSQTAGIDLADGVFFLGLDLPGNRNVEWDFTSDLPSVTRVRAFQGTTLVYEAVAGGQDTSPQRVTLGQPILIRIEFSESMATTHQYGPGPVIGTALPIVKLLAVPGNGELATLTPTSGGWRANDENIEDSVWEGTATVAAQAGLRGLQLAIYAEDCGGNPIDRDENSRSPGTLDGYDPADVSMLPGGYDTTHVIHLASSQTPDNAPTSRRPGGAEFAQSADPLLDWVKQQLNQLDTLVRLKGYEPPAIVYPGDVTALTDWFSTLTFRGIGPRLCGFNSAMTPDKQADTSEPGSAAQVISEATAQMTADGVPEAVAKTNLVVHGEAGLGAAQFVTPNDTTLYGLQDKLSTVVFNNVPFKRVSGVNLFGVQLGSQDFEFFLTGSGPIFEGIGVLYGIWAAASIVSNPSTAAQYTSASLTYLTEAGLAAVKCYSYEVADEHVDSFTKFPGGAQFKAYFNAALQSASVACPVLAKPADCSLLNIVLVGDKIHAMEDDLTNLVSGRRVQSSIGIGLMVGDATQSGGSAHTFSTSAWQIQSALAPLVTSSPAQSLLSSAAILSSLLDMGAGNGSAAPDSLLGQGVGAIDVLRGQASTQVTTIANVAAPALKTISPFLPLIGGIADAVNSINSRRNSAVAAEDMLPIIDGPPRLAVTFPVPHLIVPMVPGGAVVPVQGNVSDYLPQFIRIQATIDNVLAVDTALNLDTLTTDPDGKTGNARFAFDLVLPHGGGHQIAITAINAGGHEVRQDLTVYVDGTQFPQDGNIIQPYTALHWVTSRNGAVLSEGDEQLSFMNVPTAGETPSALVIVPVSEAGAMLSAQYPDGSPNPDIEFVNPATLAIVSTVPASGQVLCRLLSAQEGKTFVNIMGNMEAGQLAAYRLEFSGSLGQPGEGEFEGAGHRIVESAVPKAGPGYRRITSWYVGAQRLTGRYTMRTRIKDNYLPTLAPVVADLYTAGNFANEDALQSALARFAEFRDVHQASFSLGTPVNPLGTVATIVPDPYDRVEVLFEPGVLAASSLLSVNVFPMRAPLLQPLPDPTLGPLGSKFEIVASPSSGAQSHLTIEDFNANQEARVTVRYTTTQLAAIGLPPAIVEENLGLYREDPTTGQRTLLQTRLPAGSFAAYTTTAMLDGNFLLLPSNSAPRITTLVASPLVFSPEKPASGRPATEVAMTVETGGSPEVFVDVDVLSMSGETVRHLAKGVMVGLAEELTGHLGPLVAPEGADPRIAHDATVVGLQHRYHYLTTTPASLASWDGRDDAGNLVASGVYRIRLRVADGVGNVSSRSTLVVKDRIVPAITNVGTHPFAGSAITLDASTDGTSVILKGTAVNLMSFTGYRVGVRPHTGVASNTADWVGLTEGALGAAQWTFLPMPAAYYSGADPTLSTIQITEGGLASWPVAAYADGEYEAALFLLGHSEGTAAGVTVLDAVVTGDLHVQNTPAFYDLTATPNPFNATTALSVAIPAPVTGPDHTITFTEYDAAGAPVDSQVAAPPVPPSRVFTATFAPPGSATTPTKIIVTASTSLGSGVAETKSATLFQVTDSSLLDVSIFAAGVSDLGVLSVTGTARATGVDVLADWRLSVQGTGTPVVIADRTLPVSDALLGATDVAPFHADVLTVELRAEDVAGNVKTVAQTVDVPHAAALVVSPAVLTPNGDGVSDEVRIEARLVRDDPGTVEIVPEGGGAAVATFALSGAAGAQAFRWDGSGATAGLYDVRLTVNAPAPTGTFVKTVVVLVAPNATLSNGLIGTGLSPIPRAFFDVKVSGSGRYDVAVTSPVTLEKTATETFNNFPPRTYTTAVGGSGDCLDVLSPVISFPPFPGLDFDQQVVLTTELTGSVASCPEANGAFAESTLDSYYDWASIGYTSSLPKQRTITFDVHGPTPNVFDSGVGTSYRVHTLAAYLATDNCYHDLGCTYSVQAASTVTCRSTSTGVMNDTTQTPGRTTFGPVTSYVHRPLSRLYVIPFTPTHTSFYDGVTHFGAPETGSITNVDIYTAPVALTPPTGSSSTMFTYAFALPGSTPPPVANQYTGLSVKNGFFDTTGHVWDSQDMSFAGSVTIGVKGPFDRPWNVTDELLRDGLVVFTDAATLPDPVPVSRERDLAKTTYNIFERLAQQGDSAATSMPRPDFTPHWSTWTLGGAERVARYPDTGEVDPDIEIVNPQPSSVTLWAYSSLVTNDGFQIGETYDDMLADRATYRLRTPSPTPYVGRTYLKVPGNLSLQAGDTYIVEATDAVGATTLLRSAATAPVPGVLAYWNVTGEVGPHRLTVTKVSAAGVVTQQTQEVNVGFPVTDEGGVITDAYEAASVVFLNGALRSGVHKTGILKQLDPGEVPLFLHAGMVPGLIYDLRMSPSRLTPEDFVRTASGAVMKPAIIEIKYDDRQMPLGVPEAALNLFKLSSDGSRLLTVPSLIDNRADVIYAEVTESSTFQVLADDAPVTLKVRAAPSPAAPGPIVLVVEASRNVESLNPAVVTTPGRTASVPLEQEVAPFQTGSVKQITFTATGGPVDAVVLREFGPGELVPTPATAWWTGKKLLIGGASFLVEDFLMEGSPVTGGRQLVRLQGVADPVAAGIAPGQPWVLFRPTNRYLGTFDVLSSDGYGTAQVAVAGQDLLGRGVEGRGSFTLAGSAAPLLTVEASPSYARAGAIVTFSVHSLRSLAGTFVVLDRPDGGVLAFLNPTADVVEGTNLQTGLWTTSRSVLGTDPEGVVTVRAGGVGPGLGTATFVIDRTAPVVTLQGVPSHASAGVYVVTVNVSEPPASPPLLTVLDAAGHPQTLDVTANDPTTFSATLFVSPATIAEGAAKVEAHLADRAGNPGRATALMEIDFTAPVPPTGLTGEASTTTSAQLAWESVDAPDVLGYRVSRDGGVPVFVPQTLPVVAHFDTTVLPGTSEALYEVRTMDAAGNQSDPAPVRIFFDRFPPTTTLITALPRFGLTPPTTGAPEEAYAGQQPLFLAPATKIRISATDAGSGVSDRGIQVRLGALAALTPAPTDLTGASLGSPNTAVLVGYRSGDRAGNVEIERTATLFVDSVAPSTSLFLDGPIYEGPSDIIGAAIPTVPTSEADLRSRLLSIGIDVPAGEPLPSPEVLQDLLPQVTQEPRVRGVFVGPPTTLTLSATDAGSGVVPGTLTYHLTGGGEPALDETAVYSTPIALGARDEGMYRMQSAATDRVGNVLAFSATTGPAHYVIYDKTPPGRTTIAFDPPAVTLGGETYVVDDAKVILTATDSGAIPSGLARFEWRIEDEPTPHRLALTATLTLAAYAHGHHTIRFRAVDHVENAEPEERTFGPFVLTSRDWPREGFSNARTAHPELDTVEPPYKADWTSAGNWQAEVQSWVVGGSRLYAARGAGSVAGHLIALDAVSGTPVWTTTLTARLAGGGTVLRTPSGASYANGRLVLRATAASAPDTLLGVDAATGSLLWTFTPPGGIGTLSPPMAAGQPAVLPASGELAYVAWASGAGTNALLAVETTSGVLRWSRALPAAPLLTGAPAVYDGLVVVATSSGLLAFDARLGSDVWTYTGHVPTAAPTIAGTRVVTPARLGATRGIVSVNATTGTSPWFHALPGNAEVTKPLAADRTNVYAHVSPVNAKGELRVLDAVTGGLLWKVRHDWATSPPSVAAGIIYLCGDDVGAQESRLRALRRASPSSTAGVEVWRSREEAADGVPIARGRLYARVQGGVASFSQNTRASFQIVPASPVVAGTAFSLTVTAVDAQGRSVDSYTGVVSFTSSDPFAHLPVARTYTTADLGAHRYPAATLFTTGDVVVRVADPAGLTGSAVVRVFPASPIRLQAEGGDEEATLNWSYPALPGVAVTGYGVYRATGFSGPYARVALPFGRAATTYTDSGLENLVPYYYRLTAFEEHGLESPPTAPVVVTPFPGPTAPVPLVATGVAGGVALSWQASTPHLNPVSGYDVFRSIAGSPFMPIARVQGETTASYLDDTAEEGLPASYLVRGRDAVLRRGSPSNEATATPLFEHVWRHLQREASHRGNASGEIFAFPVPRKWGGPAGNFLGAAVSTARVFRVAYTVSGAGMALVVKALDRGSGTPLWQYGTGAKLPTPVIPWPAVQGDTLYVATGTKLVALGATGDVGAGTAVVRWSFTTPGAPSTGLGQNGSGGLAGRIGPTVAGGVVYLGVWGKVYAVDASLGRLRWSANPVGLASGERFLPAVVDGERVVFATSQGKVFVYGAGDFNPTTKTPLLRWSRSGTVGELAAAPTLTGNVLVLPGVAGMAGLDMDDGRTRWSVTGSGLAFAAEAAASGAALYVVNAPDGSLLKLDASTGSVAWRFNLVVAGGFTAAHSFSAPAIVSGHVLYTAGVRIGSSNTYQGRLVVVDVSGAVPSLAFVSAEDLADTNVSPAVVPDTIVTGDAAFGTLEAVRLELAAPPQVTAHETVNVIIRAVTATGNLDTSFNGSVAVFADDPQAVGVPVTRVMTGGQAAVGLILVKQGNTTLSAFVSDRPGIKGATSVNVQPTTGVVSTLSVEAPVSVFPGLGFALTVTAQDQFGNPVTTFQGSVGFTSTDPFAKLPAAEAFTKSDAGVRRFSVTLFSEGEQVITAKVVSGTSGASGTATVRVLPLSREICVGALPDSARLCALADDGYVSLHWQLPPSSATTLRLLRRENRGDLVALHELPASATLFDDLRVENRLPYSYALAAVDSTGTTLFISSEAEVTPLTRGWPMFQRNELHDAYDPSLDLPPPLGERWRVVANHLLDGFTYPFHSLQTPLSVGGTLFKPAVGDEGAARVSVTGASLYLTAYSPAITAAGHNTPALFRGKLYLTSCAGVTVREASTGAVDWQFLVPCTGGGPFASPIVYRGVLYASFVQDGAFRLLAFDVDPASASYRTVVWRTGPLGTNEMGSPAAAGGRVYLVDRLGTLHAYDAATGAALWTQSVGAGVEGTEALSLSATPPLVLVSNTSGALQAFSADDGHLLWGADDGAAITSPAMTPALVVVASQAANSVTARRLPGGVTAWHQQTFTTTGVGIRHGSPIIAGNRVHVHATNGQLFSLDLATGAVLDVLPIPSGLGDVRHLSGGDGQLYIPTGAGEIIAVTPVTPAPLTLLASGQLGGVTLTWTPPAPNAFPISGYRVFRSETAGTVGTAIADMAGPGTSVFVDATALPGQTVYYTVAAVDVRGVVGRLSNETAAAAAPLFVDQPQPVPWRARDREALVWVGRGPEGK